MNFVSKYFLKFQKLLGVGSVDLLKQNKLGSLFNIKVINFGRIKHHGQTRKTNYKSRKLCETEN